MKDMDSPISASGPELTHDQADDVLGSLLLEGLPIPVELTSGLARVVAGEITIDELVSNAILGVGEWKTRTLSPAQAS